MAESSTRTRTRINKEGISFLTHYAYTVTAHPSRAEKQTILANIRAIPGNEEFTLGKLNNWFTRYRTTSRGYDSILVDDETILFPKLTPTHLQQLRVLYRKLSEPADGVITFWAKRINADRDEVVAWIEYQQEKAKEHESPDLSPTVSDFSRPHLPTPAKSLSPQTRMLSLPPIAVKIEDKQYLSISPVLSFAPSEFDELPPCSRSVHHQQTRNRATFEQTIRDSLRSNTSPSEPPPRTADEFASQFERIEHMIDAFMKKYSSGQLAPLGWDSSLIKSTP